MAREVAAGHPPLRRARVPVDGLRRHQRRRVLRDPVHRALPAGAVRLQRRSHAVELARLLLRLRRARHRPLPALHPRRRPGLPRAPRGRLPRTTLPRPGPREVVAPGDPPLPRRRPVPRRRGLRRPWRRRGAARQHQPHRAARAGGRRRAARHGALPPSGLRPRPRPEPVGAAGRGVRLADDRPLPAVQPRPGRPRADRRCNTAHRSRVASRLAQCSPVDSPADSPFVSPVAPRGRNVPHRLDGRPGGLAGARLAAGGRGGQQRRRRRHAGRRRPDGATTTNSSPVPPNGSRPTDSRSPRRTPTSGPTRTSTGCPTR